MMIIERYIARSATKLAAGKRRIEVTTTLASAKPLSPAEVVLKVDGQEVARTTVKRTVKGWGFPRYNVSQLGPMAGTQLAIDPNAPKVSRFITLGGEPYLIRYNSRLPVVVYAPEGVEVRYRIWRAESEMKRA